MTSIARFAIAPLLVVSVACGGNHMTDPDPGAFERMAASISTAGEQHRTNMASDTPASCATEMSRYAAEVRPMVDIMSGMSDDMDACMVDMGHAESADMQATCAQMAAELDEHVARGCTVADPVAEATRHADSMRQLAEQEMERADNMHSMMGARTTMMSGRCRH